jgi:hypothetical protein
MMTPSTWSRWTLPLSLTRSAPGAERSSLPSTRAGRSSAVPGYERLSSHDAEGVPAARSLRPVQAEHREALASCLLELR